MTSRSTYPFRIRTDVAIKQVERFMAHIYGSRFVQKLPRIHLSVFPIVNPSLVSARNVILISRKPLKVGMTTIFPPNRDINFSPLLNIFEGKFYYDANCPTKNNCSELDTKYFQGDINNFSRSFLTNWTFFFQSDRKLVMRS